MIINNRSPIVQNMLGASYEAPNSLDNNEATKIADLTGAIRYSYNPAMRFQNNFQQPMMGVPQYGMVPQFSGYGMMPQNSPFGTLGYNPGAFPQYQYGNNGNRPRFGNVSMGLNNNQQYFQPTVYQDQTYTQQGYNPMGSTMMFASTDLDRFNQMMSSMAEEQAAYQDRISNMYNQYGYNYYGGFNTGYNPYISSKYQKEQYAIQHEAMERQVEFNKRLSRIAHAYLGDDIDEEYLSDIYEDKLVTIPAADVQNRDLCNRLSTFTVNYGEYTKQQYNAANNAISEEFHNKIIGNTDSLSDYLATAGELYAQGMQYDVERERRDKSKSYDRNGFNRYLAQQVKQRDGLFPNLSNSGSQFLDDGTLVIKPPEWITKATKESEESYARDRQKFIDSIYNPRR